MAAETLRPDEALSHADCVPDFGHVEAWVFDLDNTLYDLSAGSLAVVEQRICSFVQRHCNLPRDEAFALQKAYYLRYGNTLAGLMAHHGANPDDYLAYVNDVDVSLVPVDARLAPALARLPGRRFIFTNNCGRYAMRVLNRLGIAHLFNDVWDIRTVDFTPKPNPAAYHNVIGRAGIAPSRAAMFEDMSVNLGPAHALGMTTVHVAPPGAYAPASKNAAQSTGGPTDAKHIHHYTDDLPHFLSSLEVAKLP